MPLGDFDYKVMLWIRSADEAVTMNALVNQFGKSVRSTVESLCKDRFLYWDRPIDNIWGHDDAVSKIELTASGERELNNFVESERLSQKERWKARIWGILATLLVELVLWVLSHIGSIIGFFQALLSSAGQ